MLDHDREKIYLYGREKKADGKEEAPVTVDRELLSRALSTSAELGKDYTDDERAIRSAFNTYLSYLDHFNNILESGLVRKKELTLYLEYWIDILGNPKNEKLTPSVRKKLWNYMSEHGFTGAISLLKRFGYAISD
jgi:hypothetical protein